MKPIAKFSALFLWPVLLIAVTGIAGEPRPLGRDSHPRLGDRGRRSRRVFDTPATLASGEYSRIESNSRATRTTRLP